MRIQLYPHQVLDPVLYQQWQLLANSPLEHPDWLFHWWTAYRHSHALWQLKLVTIHDQDQLVGLAPFYLTGGRLRQLGSGLVCTDHQELAIARPGDRQAVIGQLVQWLWESPTADFWRVIELECVDRENETHRQLAQLHESGRQPILISDDVPNGCVPLAASWDDYLRTVSKNHRKRCRRLWKRYFASGLVQPLSTDDGWQREEALDGLIALHNQRRHDLGGPSNFANEDFVRFHRSAFPALAARGMARICGLRLDGHLIAVEYELVSPQTIYSYQSGLNPAAKQHSPGTLSIMSSIRRAIEEGKQRCDLMRGSEPYKAHWQAKMCPTHRVQAWRNSAAGRIAFSSNLLWQSSKSLVRDLVK